MKAVLIHETEITRNHRNNVTSYHKANIKKKQVFIKSVNTNRPQNKNSLNA